jgi:hypothetical protein
MKTFTAILKGIVTILSKAFLIVLFSCSKLIEVTSKAIGDGIQENLKSKP